jgi:uncharacterized protein YkwD
MSFPLSRVAIALISASFSCLLFPSFAQALIADHPTAQPCEGQSVLSSNHCQGDGIEPEEAKLYQLVNTYRQERGLPALPLSRSLSLVANRHVRDAINQPSGQNPHSWSNCNYNPNVVSTLACMWQAPQRLATGYPGRGFENLAAMPDGSSISAQAALKVWQASPEHNAVILNQGIWQRPWQAVGVGMYQGYAVLWFGDQPDPKN